jgi:O-antigen/teichoic acid export membrane protein
MTSCWPCVNALLEPGTLLKRVFKSAVAWSLFFNFFRLASGLILLPLVLRKFTTADLGMYYVLLSLSALVPLVDFGFGPTIGRFVGYAMGGATSFQTHGLAQPGNSPAPNYTLLWQLLFTSRALYRLLVLGLLLVLAAWGTYLVEMRIQETSSAWITRLAWLATLLAALFDIYSNWWVVFLRGSNNVLSAARIDVLAMGVRLVLAAALLLGGAGLLSVPVGSFLGSLIQRYLARRRCLQLLSGHPPPKTAEFKEILRVLWPNTWRAGMIFVGGYLTVNANTAICLDSLGLLANAQYGLSVQLLNVITGMAGVWTAVKWPIVAQYHARHDFTAVQRILRPRIWLQSLSFLSMAVVLLLCGPFLLAHFGSGKKVLPPEWFALLALGSFLDMQLGFWTTVIFIGNRLPFLWPVIAGNTLSLVLSLTLIHFTPLGLGALVLAPLLAGSFFNYWYWPPQACRSIGTSLFGLLFRGNSPAESQQAACL